MFSSRVLIALLSITCIQVTYGGGKLEVKFVRYVNPGGAGDNGNCCDGFSICFSSCDHEFTLCIDDVSGPDSVSSCKYGVKRSGEISEANTIDFTNKVGNLDNPMVFSFNNWPGAVKIKVDVWDLDDSSSHDFVDFLSRLFASSPSPDVSSAQWYDFQLKKRTT
ncbi:hypothetical protein CHS0354_000989 [Potamilus streckersoni]|uniref:Notch ligand N-terminal domain-containing protein n=1 Tax=Potamilus streckersoni TaxID=2493646 RepID=A0AAE0SAX7_9BIVA|nr:hypothetical protein CHS0354_000989 [Potamilus streckersoni]